MRSGNNKVRWFSILLIFAIFISSSSVLNAIQMEETETEAETWSVKGNITAPEEIVVSEIEIKVYDKDTNVPIGEAICQEDGTYEIEELKNGTYRVEFSSKAEVLNSGNYEILPAPKDAEYEVQMAEEQDYFAFAEPVTIDGQDLEINLELLEIDNETDNETEESETSTPKAAESEMTEPETAESEMTEPETEVIADDEDHGQMNIEELKQLPEDVVGTTEGKDSSFNIRRKMRAAVGEHWSFDVYYVNQNDKYHVDMTKDFNLKYQVEFHASRDIPEGGVTIKIPGGLFTDRNGKLLYPSEMAIPQGTPGNWQETKNSPFNYYIDENGDMIIFNYREIIAGSNTAFQVLYKSQQIMNIIDGTDWSLQPEITVSYSDGKTETGTTTPLTGTVDSRVHLSSVTKKPYYESGKSYTPGLYSVEQVERYIAGKLPEKYQGENFKNYTFVVWEVKVMGEATQPFDLLVKDSPLLKGNPGELVGYSVSGKAAAEEGYQQLKTASRSSSIRESIKVVTAYPSEEISEGTIMENTVDVTLHPIDGLDSDQKKAANASWNYVDYKWSYADKDGENYVSIGKTTSRSKYSGWLDVYKTAVKLGEDKGGFSFTTKSAFRGYGLTHEISGNKLGQLKDGKTYKLSTMDDVLYAYPGSQEPGPAGVILDGNDYYFSRVSIRQTDYGYDVWEDKKTQPEATQGYTIYACFAESDNPEKWEEVEYIPWESDKVVNGVLNYSFSPEQTAKKPWRVKVDHETINYLTACTIDLEVCIRHDSPKLAQLAEQYPDMTDMTIENISGVIAEEYTDGNFVKYHHITDKGNVGNYAEPGLEEQTIKIYSEENDILPKGTLVERDNALVVVSALAPHADSEKTAKTSNDVVNGRVNVNYCLTAYEGYQLYSQEAANYLIANNTELTPPGRNKVVFYDLLPYGVVFDPSVPIIAGRLTSFSGSYQSQPALWDTSQINVTMNTKTDVIPNYKETGRTMVVFHIEYEGADPAVCSDSKWASGWGLSFGAYYSWKNVDAAQKLPNISAFMPETGDQEPLLGSDKEVAKDDGVIVPSTAGQEYADFKEDINGDGVTDIRNVLYAKEYVNESPGMSGQSEIVKLVRADAEQFGNFEKSAAVEAGKGYTYDITLTNSSGRMEDIVLFDRLENAAVDRAAAEPGMNFESKQWCGEFVSLNLKGLTTLGIDVKVYYHADRKNATVSDTNKLPEDILPKDTEESKNGWYAAEKWPYDTAAVQAIALDISKKTNGTNFALGAFESVNFQIRMTAPEEAEANYAYNNPAFYSWDKTSGAEQGSTVIGNSVKVSIHGEESLEIIKEFDEGDVPPDAAEWEFLFHVYRKDGETRKVFANQEYQKFKRSSTGEWEQVSGVYATDGKGALYLKADEKAVFLDTTGVDSLVVEEEENPFWKANIEDTKDEDGGIRSVTVKNKYRPLLYVQKKVEGIPGGFDASAAEFEFKLTSNNVAVGNSEFWYVDSIRTDGGIPNKVTELGTNGTGVTRADGTFDIKPGEIIALFPGDVGVEYVLEETDGAGDGTDWVCQGEVGGKVQAQGTTAVITNYYRWKDLYLTKELTHQKAAECDQEFTFDIFEVVNGVETLVSGNRYVVMKDGKDTDIEGNLVNGRFSCKCGGKVVRIEGLESGRTYRIKEVTSPELELLYEPVNDGIAEVVMPLYGSHGEAVITNDYIKRSLTITKTAVYDPTDESEAERVSQKWFEMEIRINGQLLKNHPYIVTKGGVTVRENLTTEESGIVRLQDGETAVLKDVGTKGDTFFVHEKPDADYPQLYPTENRDHEGKLAGDGANVMFVNGNQTGILMLGKEYVGEDASGEKYIELLKESYWKREDASVTLTLEIFGEDGKKYPWPETDTTVTVIDQLSGENEQKTWAAESTFEIKPWETVLLSDMEGLKYSLKESQADQHRLYQLQDGTWIAIDQKMPAADQALTGTVDENPVAVIYNGAGGFELNGSEIKKTMRLGSADVPEGSKLVWRIEQYDGKVWKPAQGVSYIILDLAGAVSEQIQKTDTDGKIILKKTAGGYPSVHFLETEVKIHVTTGMKKGDFRVVEVLAESDEAWGYVSGYEDGSGNSGLEITPEAAQSFINSNLQMPVEIEKQMEGNTDASFTMILKQVTATKGETVKTEEDILASEARAGISYTIYNSETNEEEGQGVTNQNGEFILKAGQYVTLQIPEGTLWTVSEQVRKPYTLAGLSGRPEATEAGADPGILHKLADNLMLINQKRSIKTIKLTSAMVNAGVVDAVTGEQVVLNTGDVTIPQRIIWNGEEYIVTGIITGAFYGKTKISSVSMPDTITVIGVDAFRNCSSLTSIRWSNSLKTIEERAFADCNLGETVIIPDSVTEIGDFGFWESGSRVTKLVLSKNLTRIGFHAFSDFGGGIEELIIPEGMTEIGAYAFYNCKVTGRLVLPDTLVTIKEHAFASEKIVEGKFAGQLIIPNSVAYIGDYAFRASTGFTGSLIIPDSVEYMGEGAFADCNRKGFESVKIGTGITEIKAHTFDACTKIKNITFHDNITYIGDEAFSGCKVEEVVLPANLITLEREAFSICTLLRQISFGNKIEEINSGAFRYCTQIRTINIDRAPNTVTGYEKGWGATYPTAITINWTGTE